MFLEVILIYQICAGNNNNNSTGERSQSRTFLEYVEDNFLSQLVDEPTRGGTMLDLLFANRAGGRCGGSHLGHNDHEIIEFLIFGEIRRNINNTFTLEFQRADFGLFRRLLQRVPWEAALKNKGVQERWACFKTEILRAQEQTVPVCPKVSQRGKHPAWMGKVVLEELKIKRT